MRQNKDWPTMPSSVNASTCGFFTRKCQRAQGFRNLPHTSDGRFRKCGVKLRSADHTPVLRFRDLRFCYQKSGCARLFPIFPRTSGKRGPASCFLETKNGFRDNIQASLKRQRAIAGKPSNNPSLSPPHAESTATASVRAYYSNIQHPRSSEMRHLFCKLIPNLEAIQLAIWQITVFL